MEIAECDDAKASQMSQAIINTASEALLKDAKAASERRGSMVIREVDVNFAISRFKMLKAHKWYLIPVSGNGACQFTSIRLCMELSYILKKIEAGEPPEVIVLDGYDRDMLTAAHTTRLKIVEWYRKRLNHPVPQLGNYVEGPDARPWVRGDLLAAEMVRHGKDVPESGPGRENVILRYLLHMSERSTWGSTPEYFAAACMTGKTINVHQMNDKGELFIINSVNGSSIPAPVVIGDPQPTMEVSNTSNTSDQEFNHESSTAIVLAPELCDDATELDTPLSTEAVFEIAEETKLKDSEMDADLYSDSEPFADCSSHYSAYSKDSDSDSEEEDEYNLFFRNNHYQALVSRSQYFRLVSQYGIEAFRNFRGI